MPFHTDTDGIATLLVGHKIVGVEIDPTDPQFGTLTLDDGTVLEIQGNEGCACAAGNYYITSLATCDNIITNVEVVDTIVGDSHWEEDHKYQIFVYTAHEQIAAVEIDGTDGNGYYGTGFWIGVKGTKKWRY